MHLALKLYFQPSLFVFTQKVEDARRARAMPCICSGGKPHASKHSRSLTHIIQRTVYLKIPAEKRKDFPTQTVFFFFSILALPKYPLYGTICIQKKGFILQSSVAIQTENAPCATSFLDICAVIIHTKNN